MRLEAASPTIKNTEGGKDCRVSNLNSVLCDSANRLHIKQFLIELYRLTLSLAAERNLKKIRARRCLRI